jgi:hypothetical protein
VWARVLEKTQTLAQQSGDLDWVECVDSTILRVYQHGGTLPRTDRPPPRRADDEEPPGLRREGTCYRVHPHPGQAVGTSMLAATLSETRVPGARGRPRSRPDRVLADKGYPSNANRDWLRARDRRDDP